MRKHQFEELNAVLMTIATLIAYVVAPAWLFGLLLAKTLFDWYCASKESYREAKQEIINKQKIKNNEQTKTHQS